MVGSSETIRRQLPGYVKLRYVPELRFAVDEILVHEQRVGEILDEILPDQTDQDEEEQPGPPAD